MITRLKLLMKLKLLQIKIDYLNGKYAMLIHRTDKCRTKLSKATIKWAYINERLHPEETWEMRAEREFERLNM